MAAFIKKINLPLETMNQPFELVTNFTAAGDQPLAIKHLARGLENGEKAQVLLGVTGSGKTFTMASVVAKVQRPTLVIAPNKTLAAQLFGEFKELFPHNAVEYFVSYYDYYQPEAYIPQSDTYIEKDSSINDAIDKMRHSATRSLLTRRDVLIVASVSCIYGLGSPDEYKNMHLFLRIGEEYPMEDVKRRLAFMQYERNDMSFHRGTFRVRGDVIDIFPVHEEERALRVEFFGDTVERILLIDSLRGEVLENMEEYTVFPGSHFVTSKDRLQIATAAIKEELKDRLEYFYQENRLVEAQRLEQRTMFDLEMIQELGYCTGIENYSRHLTGKPEGAPPPNLIDYFPEDFLLFIDESHIGIGQLNGMYNGDRSRKTTLVNFGFRLPSALDNRPLRFEEFTERINQVIYVSATPGSYELAQAKGRVVEQLIRPTGLLDPRIEVIRDLRQGEFNVLVGINLLREGLDIPEVSLVAILDADKEGFLRSERSLIQTCGRAARNVNGMVIMYADVITGSMRVTIDETERRRKLQQEYNRQHGIVPETIISAVKDTMQQHLKASGYKIADDHLGELLQAAEDLPSYGSIKELEKEIKKLEKRMLEAAKELAFEEAALLRDRIKKLRMLEIEIG